MIKGGLLLLLLLLAIVEVVDSLVVVLRERLLLLHRVRLILLVRRIGHQDVRLVFERLKVVDVLQVGEDGRVQEIRKGDAEIERGETDLFDDAAGDDRADRVRDRVGDIRDRVYRAVNGDVAHVHQVAERRQQRRVDKRDAEADTANRHHQGDVGGREGDQEAAEAFEREPAGRHQPLILRILLRELDREHDAQDVRKEGGQPDHADLPVVGGQIVLHPERNGRFEEGERHVRHHERARADRDIGIHEEPPDRHRGRFRFARVLHLLLDRLHHEQQHEAVDKRDEGENEKGHLFAGELVERAAERGRHQTSEADEGERDPERLGTFVLFGEAIRDHRETRGVREGGSDALQAAREEEEAVAAAAREHRRR